MSDVNLRGTDLSWADLSDATLRDSNLKSANLTGADLSRATLNKAEYLSGSQPVEIPAPTHRAMASITLGYPARNKSLTAWLISDRGTRAAAPSHL